MNILVVTEQYPTAKSNSMEYVHVRNKYYAKNGHDVTVLCFNAKQNYTHEGIKIITYDNFKKNYKRKKYNIIILHAPNIKHHYRFIKKYSKRFNNILLIYHGHEILKINEVYPKPYTWNKNKKNPLIQDIYDKIKFILWRKQILKIINKTHLIFVSNWLYNRFIYYLHINPAITNKRIHIINNPVGPYFEENQYDNKIPKKYDFITIRGGALDGSKYGIDIVVKLAQKYPNYKFLIIGKGQYFKYNDKPKNITLINGDLKHHEMSKYINQSRCALMPTKQDTQGVLTCELSAFGIPVITSDIEICKEIFKESDNVYLINNDGIDKTDLKQIMSSINNSKIVKNERYYSRNTVANELNLIKEICYD